MSEFVGTAFLLIAIVGSGIMAARLSDGNAALALLANALATGAALFCLIAALAPISGAHVNPVMTLCDAWQGGTSWRAVPIYVMAQIVGALCGTAIANVMFGLPAFSPSHHIRAGTPLWLGEFVATFGLLVVIRSSARFPNGAAPAIACYIAAAYWFTSSTSFANPAVTIARSLTNTFAGIRPHDTPAFIVAEFVGGLTATALFAWIAPAKQHRALPKGVLEVKSLRG